MAVRATVDRSTVDRIGVPSRHGTLRLGTNLGLLIVFAATPLLTVATALGLAVMYLGLAIICFANYASARYGRERTWIIGPAVAGYGTFASLVLVVVCGAVALFGTG